jgi:hypothetical protein
MNTVEKLYEVGKHLPEPYLAELLDFAEFLIQKQGQREEITKHTIPLIELQGGLEQSINFSGNPALIQEKLRDEWH